MFETLEDRRLMAVTAGLDAMGNLNITSDIAADTIVVKEQFGEATLTVNGVAKGTFSPIGRIIINGNGGNDIITFTGYSAGADIYGGDGADTIKVYDYRSSPSIVTKVSCGAGADKAYVYAGTGVTVHGDNDNDTLVVYGGTQTKLYGDLGTDVFTISRGVTYTQVYRNGTEKVSNSGTSTSIFTVV